ncbi:aminotransferase class I/II-fold pyridoxal phosphate-dependent enzyme [Autumnicola musiva]|uniref:8-amino-7-oxononanoate synthase n=1 Tax=Autumnicola musiva TaxID=3075589 RepID=A0ABU3D8A0_9FLAO|nr:8-amino-7-oxononanoate synthase [Zunongwangia sp. F117]MDT0677761.1 8-amino-7-oxononanoate synthase [Zunongwangia sp. F117]
MFKLPLKLEKSLENRKQQSAFRVLGNGQNLFDFSSNDYLGFSSSEEIFEKTAAILKKHKLERNGATGSRLLSGNHHLYTLAEDFLTAYHKVEAALIFNSGYDANIGFFSAVPQRGDFIFYDELVHASIRDGIKMSNAKSFNFRHNELESLKSRIKMVNPENADVFIVTESVFSMDGDTPDLKSLAEFSSEKNFFLIVDEAHGTGVFGEKGEGLVQQLRLEEQVFARINTFGKAIGCHGAAILGSNQLKDYLINFARSFIFTTALPPHSVATILAAYQHLEQTGRFQLQQLNKNISFFKEQVKKHNLETSFIASDSAIQSCIITGNAEVKAASEKLREEGFSVKPILSPTVPEGKERLRFCLHSFNSEEEIAKVLKFLR